MQEGQAVLAALVAQVVSEASAVRDGPEALAVWAAQVDLVGPAALEESEELAGSVALAELVASAELAELAELVAQATARVAGTTSAMATASTMATSIPATSISTVITTAGAAGTIIRAGVSGQASLRERSLRQRSVQPTTRSPTAARLTPMAATVITHAAALIISRNMRGIRSSM